MVPDALERVPEMQDTPPCYCGLISYTYMLMRANLNFPL